MSWIMVMNASFSHNRKRRFMKSGLLERLVDETVTFAIKQQLVSPHTTLDGTLGQANASHQRFVPMEVFLKPDEYKRRIRSFDQSGDQAPDPGNPTITFRGERRSNHTHVSTTDPSIALDLPLKALAWEDAEGKVWLSYNAPEYLKRRHGLRDDLLKNISRAGALIENAAG